QLAKAALHCRCPRIGQIAAAQVGDAMSAGRVLSGRSAECAEGCGTCEEQGPAPVHRTSIVASKSNVPMLTTSVAVVRKMLDAVAGSKPKRFSVIGTSAPERPLAIQEKTIARKTTK